MLAPLHLEIHRIRWIAGVLAAPSVMCCSPRSGIPDDLVVPHGIIPPLATRSSRLQGACSNSTITEPFRLELILTDTQNSSAFRQSRRPAGSRLASARLRSSAISVRTVALSRTSRVCGWRLESGGDVLVEGVVAAVDAMGVNGEQDVDAVPGAGGNLCGFPARVQP